MLKVRRRLAVTLVLLGRPWAHSTTACPFSLSPSFSPFFPFLILPSLLHPNAALPVPALLVNIHDICWLRDKRRPITIVAYTQSSPPAATPSTQSTASVLHHTFRPLYLERLIATTNIHPVVAAISSSLPALPRQPRYTSPSPQHTTCAPVQKRKERFLVVYQSPRSI